MSNKSTPRDWLKSVKGWSEEDIEDGYLYGEEICKLLEEFEARNEGDHDE